MSKVNDSHIVLKYWRADMKLKETLATLHKLISWTSQIKGLQLTLIDSCEVVVC